MKLLDKSSTKRVAVERPMPALRGKAHKQGAARKMACCGHLSCCGHINCCGH